MHGKTDTDASGCSYGRELRSFKKYFKINSKTGKVTIKKGLKKGTYRVSVKVSAAGNSNYNPSGVKTVSFKIKVK